MYSEIADVQAQALAYHLNVHDENTTNMSDFGRVVLIRRILGEDKAFSDEYGTLHISMVT